MTKMARISFKVLDLLIIFVLTFGSPMSAAAQVWTNPTDYPPGSVVTIRGDNSDEDNDHNFLANEGIHVDVVGPNNGYTLACDTVSDENGAWACDVTLASDPAVAVGEYIFTATGQESGNVETGMFTDGPANYVSLDFVASAPLTYDHTTGGGAFDDRTVGRADDIVESLEGGDFQCGEVASFLLEIDLDGTQSNPGTPRTARFVVDFTLDTTGQTGLALGPVTYAAVNYGPVSGGNGPGGTDSGMDDDLGSVATLVSQSAPTIVEPPYFTAGEVNSVVIDVTDLEGSENVILRIDAEIACKFGSAPTGNLQASITDADIISLNPNENIPVGNQTVPFKAAGDVIFPGVIIVDKVTDPSDAEDLFDFKVSAPGGPISPTYLQTFQLADQTTPWNSGYIDPSYAMIGNTNTFVAGSYTVEELSPFPVGWGFDSGTCVNQNGAVQGTDGQSITFDLDENEIVTCTFNNSRNTGNLTLSKALTGGPDGYTGPFTIHYDCGTDFTNDVSVDAGSSVTIYDIPDGTSCTISEPTLPNPPGGYSFGQPTFSPSDTVQIAADTTVTVTTNNTLTRDVGSLKILKTLSNPDGASVPASFAVNYDCGTGYTGQVSVAPGSPATVSGIPTGNVCTVTEVAPAAIPGFTWGTITYTPASVTIDTKGGTFEITVGNSITRDRGSLKILKTVSGASFSGSFSVSVVCTGDGGSYNPSINYPSPGYVVINNIPTGNTCTVTEPTFPTPPTGYVWGTPVITGSPASITIGATVEVTVANSLHTSHANVIKTVGGQPISATNNCMDLAGNIVGCTFQLRQGASTTQIGTTLETKSTLVNGQSVGTLSFSTNLTPGQTYQMCEVVMPGWLTSLGTFVPNSFIPPDGLAPNPTVDNSILCVDFVTTPDETKVFTIDNTPPPGGRGLTIGFWKNWASCTSSSTKKLPILDQTMAKAEPTGIVVSATSGTYPAFGQTFYLVLHGSTVMPNAAPDCLKALRLLDKSTINTDKKMASDPAFNLAAQLVAAQLNYAAGAGKKPAVTNAIQQAVLLLGKYKFDGQTHTKISNADATTMNNLAKILDDYNNNR
jgi:hypothetical protein